MTHIFEIHDPDLYINFVTYAALRQRSIHDIGKKSV